MGAGGRSVLVFSFLLTLLAAGAGVQAACDHPYSGSGDWIISTAVVCNDTSVTLNGDLIIESSGSLEMDNVTLDITPPSYGVIAINNSGSLSIQNSFLRSLNGNGYMIISGPESSILIEDSYIRNITIGISVNSDNNLIQGNNISEGCFYINGSMNVIKNNIISDAESCSVIGSSNMITNNIIQRLDLGFYAYVNNTILSNNVFRNSSVGITLNGDNNIIEKTSSLNNFSPLGLSIGLSVKGRNNTVSEFTSSNNTIGLYSEKSYDLKITNSNFENNTDTDIILESSRLSDFSGNTYDTLIKIWSLTVSAVSGNGSAVSGATVVISNRTGAVVNTQTGSDGKTPWFTVTEYYENSGNITSANPYTISVTKTGVSPGSAVINITSDTTVNITMGAQQLTPFNLVVESPANKTYMQNDPELVNMSFIRTAITSNLNMTSCNSTIRGYTEEMGRESDRTFAGYFSITGYSGQYVMSFICASQDGRTGSASVQFTLYSVYTCLSSADCAEGESCVSNDCSELNCGCGYPSNHTCIQYRCCENTQCNESDYCEMTTHECRRVECTCGSIANHQCARATGYCCDDTHCGENQICRKEQHQCITRTLNIVTEGDALIGRSIKVYVFDQDNKSVQDAGITVLYQDTGKSEAYFTNIQKDGRFYAEIPITEQGRFQVTARKAGFETQKVVSQASYDYFSVILPALIIIIIIPLVLFFFKTHKKSHVEDVTLSLDKDVNGQEVRLKIKNRSGKTLENLEVTDQVPVDSFIWSAMMPRITLKNSITDFLMWEILRLQPGEEVVIAYRTNKALSGFTVKVEGKEYKK
jgi:hypothetical protein